MKFGELTYVRNISKGKFTVYLQYAEGIFLLDFTIKYI